MRQLHHRRFPFIRKTLRRIAELKDMLGTDVVEAIRSEVAAELMYELDE